MVVFPDNIAPLRSFAIKLPKKTPSGIHFIPESSHKKLYLVRTSAFPDPFFDFQTAGEPFFWRDIQS